MKYLNEYREESLVKRVIQEIHRSVTRPWVIMEICGGQTHAILDYGLDDLLPSQIEMIHGPGCPVCVTPLEKIDRALEIASQPGVIFTTFGDMLRIPGSEKDLYSVRANGGQIRVVYSPLDAVRVAQDNPDKEVVFFAIGFETTAPVNAMSIIQAQALKLKNFSVLVSLVCVPPVLSYILNSTDNRVEGILAAGHVCAVMGYWEYLPIAARYHIPIVVTGFEPLDLVQGVLMTVRQLEKGTATVENAYSRVVTLPGNRPAQTLMNRVFEPGDCIWRGICSIPLGGLNMRTEFDNFNAEKRFDLHQAMSQESTQCIAGMILQGIKKPTECPAFGTQCQPPHPLGAPMVSSEGACAAYYRYKQWERR